MNRHACKEQPAVEIGTTFDEDGKVIFGTGGEPATAVAEPVRHSPAWPDARASAVPSRYEAIAARLRCR